MESPYVFLSYASPDRDRVSRLHDFLRANGVNVWMDSRQLIPGQHWEFEIRRAMDGADVIVLCMSRNSVDRTGYVQRELRMAIDRLQNRPLHRIYAVPLLLDHGLVIPDQVREIQCLDMTHPAGNSLLLKAVRAAFDQIGEVSDSAQSSAEVCWRFETLEERWEGVPGYHVDVSWPVYESERYPRVSQISDIIRGEILSCVAAERAVKLDQWPDSYSFGQVEAYRTNVSSIGCEPPVIKHQVLSQRARHYWYGAGAAHGNHGFDSWVFLLDPIVRINELSSVFETPDDALRRLQTEARPRLLADLEAVEPSGNDDILASTIAQIAQGTDDWQAFASFSFEQDGLMLMFPAYQVAPYSSGSRSVVIPYSVIGSLLRRTYRDALGLLLWETEDAPLGNSLDDRLWEELLNEM